MLINCLFLQCIQPPFLLKLVKKGGYLFEVEIYTPYLIYTSFLSL